MQADSSLPHYIISRLLSPDIFSMLIPISVIALVGTIIVTKLIVKHRERMAKIEHGIDPDEKSDHR